MDWTAITGIVVAGVVGPAVTGWLAIRRQDDQQAHEQSRDDLADLRSVLAEAAKELQQAEGMTGAMKGYLLEQGEQIHINEGSKLGVERFRATAREMFLTDARIAIRLEDDDPVAVAHHEAVLAIERAANALGLVGGLGGADLKWVNDELTAGGDQLRAARSDFNRAAREKVGTGVGSGRNRRLAARLLGESA